MNVNQELTEIMAQIAYFHLYWKNTVIQNKFTSMHNLPSRQTQQSQNEPGKRKRITDRIQHIEFNQRFVIQQGDL